MLLNNSLFSHYLRLLSHYNERQRTDCLQDLFFYLLKGGLLHPNQWKILIPQLIKNMDQTCDATLRRWAYQVASFSIKEPSLTHFLINNIQKEKNNENCSWIVAILSKNLSKKELDGVLSKKSIDLSTEHIMLSSYLYSESSPFDPRSIINSGDPLSLMWIASIGAYKRIAEFTKKYPIVSSEELSLLTSETDNDEVLKHVMYAFSLQERFKIDELRFNPSDYKKMGNQQKKWFFTLMWKDKDFLAANIDLFREVLSERHLFIELDDEVRIGIARGMEKSPFIPELAPYIVNRYSHEQTPSSQNLLLRHMIKNQDEYGDYRDIIEYQKINGDESIRELILVENGDKLNEENKTKIKKIRGEKMATIPSFKIGVTFCGEYREDYVLPFCEALLEYDDFSKDNIFYDEWHDYLINGVHGDKTLRKIYNEKCDLVVVLLSPNYSSKPWTGNIEWPSILDLINQGDDDKICLLRIKNTAIDSVSGLFKNQAIAKSIDNLTPKQIAEFIYKKWSYMRQHVAKVQNQETVIDDMNIENLARYTDSQLEDILYKANDATRRAWCIELIKARKADDLIEECISIMSNNAEKIKFMKELARMGYAGTDYFESLFRSLDNGKYQFEALKLCTIERAESIEECFLMIENNKYIYEALVIIYDYDKALFHKLYRGGDCFSNNTYAKKMTEWLKHQSSTETNKEENDHFPKPLHYGIDKR